MYDRDRDRDEYISVKAAALAIGRYSIIGTIGLPARFHIVSLVNYK